MFQSKTVRMLFAMAISFALSGCGSSSSSPQGDSTVNPSGTKLYGACDLTQSSSASDRQCREWHGSLFAGFDLKVSCEGIGGIYSTEACSTQNHIGTCILDRGGALETRLIYYASEFDLISGEANCKSKSTIDIGGNLKAEWFPAFIAAPL